MTRAWMACSERGLPGYMVAGECLDVSPAEMEDHPAAIAKARADARADCVGKDSYLMSETITWKGIYRYDCAEGTSGGDESLLVTCPENFFVDLTMPFGNDPCQPYPGCPGGANRCGSATCP